MIETIKSNVDLERKEMERIVRCYGTSAMTVKFEMHVTSGELTKTYGERCKEYEPGCCVCENWLLWCRTGRAEFTLERQDLLKLLLAEAAR